MPSNGKISYKTTSYFATHYPGKESVKKNYKTTEEFFAYISIFFFEKSENSSKGHQMGKSAIKLRAILPHTILVKNLPKKTTKLRRNFLPICHFFFLKKSKWENQLQNYELFGKESVKKTTKLCRNFRLYIK